MDLFIVPYLKSCFLQTIKLRHLRKFKDLKDVKHLEELSLELNPFSANSKAYLSFCFAKCPNLKVLDGKKESDLNVLKPLSSEEQKSSTDGIKPTLI